mgnify:CR=1 FL=1
MTKSVDERAFEKNKRDNPEKNFKVKAEYNRSPIRDNFDQKQFIDYRQLDVTTDASGLKIIQESCLHGQPSNVLRISPTQFDKLITKLIKKSPALRERLIDLVESNT